MRFWFLTHWFISLHSTLAATFLLVTHQLLFLLLPWSCTFISMFYLLMLPRCITFQWPQSEQTSAMSLLFMFLCLLLGKRHGEWLLCPFLNKSPLKKFSDHAWEEKHCPLTNLVTQSLNCRYFTRCWKNKKKNWRTNLGIYRAIAQSFHFKREELDGFTRNVVHKNGFSVCQNEQVFGSVDVWRATLRAVQHEPAVHSTRLSNGELRPKQEICCPFIPVFPHFCLEQRCNNSLYWVEPGQSLREFNNLL